METEFWAAIAGAVIGGGITVFGQFVYERRRSWEAEKAAVTGLFFKALRIQTDLANARDFLTSGFRWAHAMGIPAASGMMPSVNEISPVAISPNELSIVLELRDDDLLNLMVSLQQQHELLSSSLTTYKRLRAEMDAMSHGGIPDHSGLSDMAIDRADAELFVTRVAVASNMLIMWYDQTVQDYHCAREALHRLGLHLRHRYRRPIGMSARRDGS